MLEAALQQMDGIISNSATATVASTEVGGGGGVGSQVLPPGNNATAASLTSFCERNLISATNVLSTAKTLAVALQQVSQRSNDDNLYTIHCLIANCSGWFGCASSGSGYCCHYK